MKTHMTTTRVTFIGREVNAIGVFRPVTLEITHPIGASLEDIRLLAYETHEHITRFKVICEEE